MLKRIFVAAVTFVAILCFTVGGEAASKNNWLIYWYVCGTDIETTRIHFSNGTNLMSDRLWLYDPDNYPGDATRCIKEVENANISPNVKIFMQAGGTYIWGHEKFRNNNAKIDTSTIGLDLDAKGNPLLDENGQFKIKKNVTVLSRQGVNIAYWTLSKDDPRITPVSNGKIGRYLYDVNHHKWRPIEELNITGKINQETDMGSKAGLVSFLRAGQKFEREKYPDGNVRRVLIFVDHGAGIGGICVDEYTGNKISLNELREAFNEVQDGWRNTEGKPFEVVAFDACIMANYETALAVKDAADYMVASQESMYGSVMFGYTDLLNSLSKNPEMSGKELGKVICDTYWDDSKRVDKERKNIRSNEILTISVVDLDENKIDALKSAYDDFGKEALAFVRKNPDEFIQNLKNFNNAANRSERFPANRSLISGGGRWYQSPELVDLKGFAENTKQNIPELQTVGGKLAGAVSDAVVYKRAGNSVKNSNGLSTYYPFNFINSGNSITYYNWLANDNLASKDQGKLYSTLLEDFSRSFDISEDAKNYTLKANSPLNIDKLSNAPVSVKDGIVSVSLDNEEMKGVENVHALVGPARPRTDGVDGYQMPYYYGINSDIEEDWQSGIFKSKFSSEWLTVGNNPVFLQILSDYTKRNKNGKKIGGSELCKIPIMLNDISCDLIVSIEYPKKRCKIIGVSNKVTQGLIPDNFLFGFNKGDVVSFMYPKHRNLNDKSLTWTPGFTITIGDKLPKLEFKNLPDGDYCYVFEFVSPISDYSVLTTDHAVFKIKNGKITDIEQLTFEN